MIMTREQLISIFPEISFIKTEDLKNKVIEVWLKALEIANWENVYDIPFSVDLPKDIANMVKHIRAVTNYSLKTAEVMNNLYNYNLNMDHVIAGGLLHDVSKAVEFSAKGSRTDMGNSIAHGVYGVHLCINAGLPLEVIHIVASHSKRMDIPTKSIEAIIVRRCDNVDADSIHNFFNDAGKRTSKEGS